VGWTRNDDDMLDHEKWRRALRHGGDGALLMWTRFTSWCSRRLTDGEVPGDMVEEIGQLDGSKTRARALKACVDASLLAWCDPNEDTLDLRRGRVEPTARARRDGDVLVVVGYLQRNPSRSKVESDRERRAQGQQNRRAAQDVTGHAETTPEPSCPSVTTSRPVPSRPVPTPEPPPGADQSLSSPPPAAIDPPPPADLAAVREVFTEWQRVHRHLDAKLDAKRTARIRSGLKLFEPEQLKQAIRGALKDDWLMGRDPKSPRKYDGLETLLRDNAQIERLIELERAPPSIRRIGPPQPRDRQSDVFAYALNRISEEQAKEGVSS
jgi:hypothetical protein